MSEANKNRQEEESVTLRLYIPDEPEILEGRTVTWQRTSEFVGMVYLDHEDGTWQDVQDALDNSSYGTAENGDLLLSDSAGDLFAHIVVYDEDREDDGWYIEEESA